MTDLVAFKEEVFQDVVGAADAESIYLEDAFFDYFCDYLVDAGELDTHDRAAYDSPKGVRVDGYGGDPLVNDEVLSLIILDFVQDESKPTLTRTDMDKAFKRAMNFLSKSLEPSFREAMEPTLPAFGLADLIAVRWQRIRKVRLLLVSNRELSTRIDSVTASEVDGKAITHSVWDISRLHRYVAAGREREDIEIDLEDGFGGAIPVLPAHSGSAKYKSYLAVVPGQQLAAIYERWGTRLLEQNVRVFLQARGNVNKGIRNTIENAPEMFLAYNNGIAATAESLELRENGGQLEITGLRNMQIVNGGQTTASIHVASRRKDLDISKVFVQMKLSIVERERVIEVVPKISEYANTQNRVNAADFFANHPFHVRMEEFSRRIYAPSPDGTFRESKWFYERARGQYQDARANLKESARRKFDLEYPKRQVFKKTDLAKFEMVWQGRPDMVSKGAQKNFAEFAKITGTEWEKSETGVNEDYYKRLVAKAIVFRETERIVSSQEWYEGGYRANIVAYAIAKLGSDVESLGKHLDWDLIWRRQGMGEALGAAIAVSASAVNDVLLAPPAGMRNISEWAKQQACWNRVQGLEIDWPLGWQQELISSKEQQARAKAARSDQRQLNGIAAQTAVVEAGADFWRRVNKWGRQKDLLSEKEQSILKTCAAIPKKVPTEKQSVAALEALARLHTEGCQLGPDIIPT